MRIHLISFTSAILVSSASVAIAQHVQPAPHLLIYKTKADHKKQVPVILSEDKSKIVSYPDPHDVKAGGERLLPTPLHKGYLLDNRGIGSESAFVKMTWKQYASKTSISPVELYRKIKNKDPFVVICDCGKKSDFKDPVEELNKLIDQGKLSQTCKVIKGKLQGAD